MGGANCDSLQRRLFTPAGLYAGGSMNRGSAAWSKAESKSAHVHA